eukprot:800201-Pyramimonas_sp.AAC.1
MGVRDACGLRHWDLRWSSLWGHEACEGVPKWVCVTHAGCAIGTVGGAPYGATKRVMGCAAMRGRGACVPRHWDLRRSPLRGHETYEGCAA